MSLLLLRHAHAGDRSRWAGDDRLRPLSPAGRRQADAIAAQYAARPVERVLSSPYLRCVQTVEPLASARGLDVEEVDELAEGSPPAVVRELLRRLDGTDAVLCTHGDVVAGVMTDLVRRGIRVAGRLRWPKGSTWVLDGTQAAPAATFLPPPS